jgi:hypothetical protein
MSPTIEALRALREKLTADDDPSGYFQDLVDAEIARHKDAKSEPCDTGESMRMGAMQAALNTAKRDIDFLMRREAELHTMLHVLGLPSDPKALASEMEGRNKDLAELRKEVARANAELSARRLDSGTLCMASAVIGNVGARFVPPVDVPFGPHEDRVRWLVNEVGTLRGRLAKLEKAAKDAPMDEKKEQAVTAALRPLANVAQDGNGWAPMTYHVWLDLPCHDVAPVKSGMRRADADGLANAINARARDELRDRLAKLEAAAQRAYEFYACECECDKCECECAGCTISRELGALLKKETA